MAPLRLSSRAAITLMALGIGSLPARSLASATYSVTLQGATQTSGSPLEKSYSAATPGVAPTIIHETAGAGLGVVGAKARLQTAWPFDIQTGLSGGDAAAESTDSFVITGPPGITSVQASMLFRSRIDLAKSGGLPGSDRHKAGAVLHVTAASLQADGSCWLDNHDAGSDGVLAGHAPPAIDAVFSLTGTFPVGQPFGVSLDFDCTNSTFGDSSVSPGITDTDGLEDGLSLGDASGRVMQLPPGYDVAAPDWNVSSNHITVAGAPGTGETRLQLAPATPNPSNGRTTLELSLPHAGQVSALVTDLQGRVVRRLFSGLLSAGRHDETWDGRRDSGELSPSGVYVVVVRFEGQTLTRRLTRIR